jgi:hypothetical protein
MVSMFWTAKPLPPSASSRLSLPAPRSAMASASEPVTVTESASVPPIRRSKPASSTLLAVLGGRVMTDRGLLRLWAAPYGVGPRQGARLSLKKRQFYETNLFM